MAELRDFRTLYKDMLHDAKRRADYAQTRNDIREADTIFHFAIKLRNAIENFQNQRAAKLEKPREETVYTEILLPF